MIDDFVLIKHELDWDIPHINIYPIGDLHIGSASFNTRIFKKWRETVLADPYGYVVMVGDMMDNGLKNSKTNSYEATMQPFEQKQWVKRELEPIAHKILGVVQGNHEYRSNIVADICPLYDIMAKLDLEDLYRPNMAFIKINVGRRTSDRQCSYTLVLTHGASKGKTENFGYAIDGMDVMITGHLHQPISRFPSKIVIDSKNEVVSLKGYTHISVPSFAEMGGYALKGLYLPQDSNKYPVITLSGQAKEVSVSWM